ncbi:MAG: geranylgeranylglyceryl/heptaprenylglyceryl phosphate synthase [Bacteroidia bacterium]|nr:geranylgeranylglyceryl/heptaprenylglyceryl phosphate synthase [Bacteroidia bacterium]
MNTISEKITSGKQKMFAVLIDPDKSDSRSCEKLALSAGENKVDFIFAGSSILTGNRLDACIGIIKKNCSIPVVLFPGNALQISRIADAILFLSLISGRNAELLIGSHVTAAPYLRETQLEILPTGYMVIDSGTPTSVSYMSQTMPIPHGKNDIAACTAMAGEMLGLKFIFMDAGSGAKYPVSSSMIAKVRESVKIPIIVGGGIRTGEKAFELCRAGADVIVVGNALEKEPMLLPEISSAVNMTI